MTASDQPCPCGSGKRYAECCQSVHQDRSKAAQAEQLMRARFSAYVLGNAHFLKQSWAPETCPAQLDADSPSPWKSLTVMPTYSDSPDQVHFRATGFDGKDWFVLEEHARFIKDAGGWLYHSGDVEQHRLVPGRNDACPCGSGLKYKRCCLSN